MNLNRIFDVNSRLPEAANGSHDVPETTRNRILSWWQEFFNRGCGNAMQFWLEIHRAIKIRLGRAQLGHGRPGSEIEDTVDYLMRCPGKDFLAFLMDLFRTDHFRRMQLDWDRTIDDLNKLLRVDDLPYSVTKFVTERKALVHDWIEIAGACTTPIVEYPRVIMKESEVLHSEAIEPALQLLRNPAFAHANKEFLEALEDYRKGDHRDCLTKCGSSFESLMKVICDEKGWTCKQTDPAATLIKTILPNTNLDSYFETLLMIVATLRNKLSSAHGAGTVAKVVPPHLAQYAINVTASAMILLATEAGL